MWITGTHQHASQVWLYMLMDKQRIVTQLASIINREIRNSLLLNVFKLLQNILCFINICYKWQLIQWLLSQFFMWNGNNSPLLNIKTWTLTAKPSKKTLSCQDEKLTLTNKSKQIEFYFSCQDEKLTLTNKSKQIGFYFSTSNQLTHKAHKM